MNILVKKTINSSHRLLTRTYNVGSTGFNALVLTIIISHSAYRFKNKNVYKHMPNIISRYFHLKVTLFDSHKSKVFIFYIIIFDSLWSVLTIFGNASRQNTYFFQLQLFLPPYLNKVFPEIFVKMIISRIFCILKCAMAILPQNVLPEKSFNIK